MPDFENSCYTDTEAIKSSVFWMLVMLIIGSSLGNFYLVMNYKNAVKMEQDHQFKN